MTTPRQRLAEDPTDVSALCAIAGAYQHTEPMRSATLFGRAYAATGRAVLGFMMRRMTATSVKAWHTPMINDHRRNHAFAEAIRHSVNAQTTVLEIGLGSGLLSMVAAAAGARTVVGCEESPAIAEAARRVIARNRFSDRIKIVAKRSTDVAIGADLPEPADLVVAELVSADLLSEHIIPALEDARARLAKPGAPTIPRGAKVKAALIEMDRRLAQQYLPDVAEGFDLSAFADFSSPTFPLPEDAQPIRLSPVFDLLTFDFMSAKPIETQTNGLEVPIEKVGRLHGVLQWIELDLAPGVTYENRPNFQGEPAPWSHWPAIFHYGYASLDVAPGHRVAVEGQHNRISLLVVQHGRVR
jgi:predicted O-methyltransferase YrrM